MPAPRIYYEDESVQLWLGDARDVLPTLTPNWISALVTDAPYGARRPSARRLADAQFDEIAGNDSVQVDWLPDAVNTLTESAAAYCFCTWDTLVEWKSGMESADLRVRSAIVWDKGIHGLADLQTCWAPRHGMILFGATGRHELRSPRPVDVIRCDRVSADRLLHPYEKPVGLMSRIIAASTDPGDWIIDPFCGSGPTLVAAKQLGRRAVGIEISEENCQIAANRLKQGVLFGITP